MEDKLKKNALSFKNAFVNENNEFLKFCRECQKRLIKLETKRGDNIQKYIVYLKRGRQTNTEKHDTLVDDDHLPLAGSLGEKRKITITHYSYEKKEKKNATVELDTENLRTEIQEPFKNDIEEVKIDLNITVNDEFLPSTESVEENSDTENKDDKLTVPNVEQSDGFLAKASSSEIRKKVNNKILDDEKKDASHENNTGTEKELLSYDYWFNLWKEMFCSDGYGPEFRVNYNYCMKKMAEAKKNGFAKDEIKDYNYWTELWKDMFASDRSDQMFLDEVNYVVQKRRETKREEEK